MEADRKKVLTRLKTARGQIDGIIKMVEEDKYCIDISNQVLSTVALLKSTNKIVLADHLSHCVLHSMNSQDEDQVKEKLEEIEMIIEKLSK